MTAQPTGVTLAVPDDASSLIEQCSSRDLGKDWCQAPAKWRALIHCPGCGKDAARPVCNRHRDHLLQSGTSCAACFRAGTPQALLVIAWEAL